MVRTACKNYRLRVPAGHHLHRACTCSKEGGLPTDADREPASRVSALGLVFLDGVAWQALGVARQALPGPPTAAAGRPATTHAQLRAATACSRRSQHVRRGPFLQGHC